MGSRSLGFRGLGFLSTVWAVCLKMWGIGHWVVDFGSALNPKP